MLELLVRVGRGPPVQQPPSDVERVFRSWPAPAQERLRELRALILDTAAATEGVGPLTETLKWGEPAYLPERPRTGTTVRLGWKAKDPEHFALYVHCGTSLVDTFRSLHPELTFGGNRAVLLRIDEPLPKDAVARCIGIALTWHARKRAAAG
jgi:hypothetical protein